MRRVNIQKIYVFALALIIAPVLPMFTERGAAAELTGRSVTIGSSVASANTSHAFAFNVISGSNVGSIRFLYCSNSPLVNDPCTAPAGLNAGGATIAAQNGETGFGVHSSTNANTVVLSRVPVAATPQPVSYAMNNIVNPSSTNTSTYVRISTYASDDATGASTDSGAVVFSINVGLGVSSYVPPYLTFCVGISIANDCTSVSGNYINLGELSKTEPNTSVLQFAAATNDPGGYQVTIDGTTMTSGNIVIPALTSPTSSQSGQSQYGINLRANTVPPGGANISGMGSGVPRPDYDIPNQFKFVPGEIIASSPLPTEFNVFTTSYLINVANDQAPGIYSATHTYIATAAF